MSGDVNTLPGSTLETNSEKLDVPSTACSTTPQIEKEVHGNGIGGTISHPVTVSLNPEDFRGNFGVDFTANTGTGIASKLPILANALSVAAPFGTRIQAENTEVFFMTPDGTLKRKLLCDEIPLKRQTATYMPGTSIPYRTPGQSSKNRNGKIKRPMNAFMIWARTARTKLAQETPNASNAEISVKLGEVWSQLPREEKQKFYLEAERVKAKHRQDFPDWIYQPEPPKKIIKTESQTLWDKYNENRPKVQKPRQAPHGTFIKYIGHPNKPILPRNVYPLQQVTFMPQGNQFGVSPRMPFLQQLPTTTTQNLFMPLTADGNNLRQLIPFHCDTPRLQRQASNLDFNSVQNVTIIHPKGAGQAVRGRPNTVTEKVQLVQESKGETQQSAESTEETKKEVAASSKTTKSDSKTDVNESKVPPKTSNPATPKKTPKKSKKNEKPVDKKLSKKKQKSSDSNTTREISKDIDEESVILPGSTTQPNEEHPEDFWPFPFPPAEQEAHMDMFEGEIHEPEEGDPYTSYLCPVKAKPDDDRLHVDVSSWQQYLKNDQQKTMENTEKLDAYFVDKAEVVSCPSDLDICPVPVALTLTRQDSHDQQTEKLNSSFGTSISNALNILGGENDTECSDDATVMQIDSKGNLTERTISMKDIEILQPDDHNQLRNLNTAQFISNSETDTRPFKKRTNRYFQDMEDNLVIVE